MAKGKNKKKKDNAPAPVTQTTKGLFQGDTGNYAANTNPQSYFNSQLRKAGTLTGRGPQYYEDWLENQAFNNAWADFEGRVLADNDQAQWSDYLTNKFGFPNQVTGASGVTTGVRIDQSGNIPQGTPTTGGSGVQVAGSGFANWRDYAAANGAGQNANQMGPNRQDYWQQQFKKWQQSQSASPGTGVQISAGGVTTVSAPAAAPQTAAPGTPGWAQYQKGLQKLIHEFRESNADQLIEENRQLQERLSRLELEDRSLHEKGYQTMPVYEGKWFI